MPAGSEILVNDLRTRVERLELLLMIGRMMHATSDQEELINSIALAVGHYLEADRCSIFFHDKLTDELYTHLAVRTDGQMDEAINVRRSKQFTGVVNQSIAIQIIGQQTIVGAYPGSLLGKAVLIEIKITTRIS